jgi:hypothetical protein
MEASSASLFSSTERSNALLRLVKHPKGKCEAGQPAHTARYTHVFARRVVDSLEVCEVWSYVVQELQEQRDHEVLAAEVGEEQEEEITAEEKHAIELKVQHIHRSTGHGSMKNLIDSLKKRGVPPKVLRVAQAWKLSHIHITEPTTRPPIAYAVFGF